MKILYVEDKSDFAETFSQLIMTNVPGASIDVVCSLDEAMSSLSETSYEVAILDLAIPRDNMGAAHVEVGAELARLIADGFAGMPIIIFTGQLDERETDELHDEVRRRVRFSGGSERALLSVKRKDQADKVLNILTLLGSEKRAAEAIALSDLDNRALATECSEDDRRLLRAFCIFRGGARGRVQKLSGGLSGSAVYRLDVLATDGSVIQRAVAKFDSSSAVEREAANYNAFVTRLPSGYPAVVPCDLVVGGARRAIFYNLAEDFNSNLFDFFVRPADLLALVKQRLRNWHEYRENARLSIRDRVLDLGGERALDALLALGIDGIYGVIDETIDTAKFVQHGDLHGANVLCDVNGAGICLIDFGDVGVAIGPLDAVTLELSPFFHPSLACDPKILAAKKLADSWFNDQRMQEEAVGAWFVEIRRWGRERAVSHLDFAATVLAYAARQLKYPDTDHDFAKSLVVAALRELKNR